jgi:hypothetical protein
MPGSASCAGSVSFGGAGVLQIACTFATIGFPNNFSSYPVEFRGCTVRDAAYLVREAIVLIETCEIYCV